jgi:tetratricopeptide (TPR) repeat protein
MAQLRVARGRTLGIVTGSLSAGLLILLSGTMTASPEYLDADKGLPLGALGALIGFTVGTWVDRRVASRQADEQNHQRWTSVFVEEPAHIKNIQEPSQKVSTGTTIPLKMLDPSQQFVPFESSHRIQARAIRRWFTDLEPGKVCLLTGSAGAGKTRTAIRASQYIKLRRTGSRECAWLKRGTGLAKEAIALAASRPCPVLIIVDDADRRDDLHELLIALSSLPPDGQRVRLLLIAREFGTWWGIIQRRTRSIVDLAGEIIHIGPFADSIPRQMAAARRAVQAFADELDVSVNVRQVEISGVQADTPALLLHATALEAVLQVKDGYSAPVSVTDAVASLLDREYDLWMRRAADHNLHLHSQVSEGLLREALVLATLVGAISEDDTESLLRQIPALADMEAETVVDLTNWLRLYGAVAGYDVRSYLPATIHDYLIIDAINESDNLASIICASADTNRKISYVVHLIAQAAAHVPAADGAARKLIAVDQSRLLPYAVGQNINGINPLDQAMSKVIENAGLSWKAASNLLEQLKTYKGDPSPQTAIALSRVRADQAANEHERALALTQHAFFIIRSGIDTDRTAIAPAREAVAIRRELMKNDPSFHLPYLIEALDGLGAAFIFSGRPMREGLDAANEAVELVRVLAEGGDGVHLAHLASSLTTAAAGLCIAGEPEAAQESAREAVALCRQLVNASSGSYLSPLANALKTLACVLFLTGHKSEAIESARQAGQACLGVVDPDPYVQAPYIVYALKILAGALVVEGHKEEAIALGVKPEGSLKNELAEMAGYKFAVEATGGGEVAISGISIHIERP